MLANVTHFMDVIFYFINDINSKVNDTVSAIAYARFYLRMGNRANEYMMCSGYELISKWYG